MAVLRKLLDRGHVQPDETVVLFNTGTPSKNPSPPRHSKLVTVASADDVVKQIADDAG